MDTFFSSSAEQLSSGILLNLCGSSGGGSDLDGEVDTAVRDLYRLRARTSFLLLLLLHREGKVVQGLHLN